MAEELDPEGVETRIVHELIDFTERDVLEVGCGDGRLTRRYADRVRTALALDPDATAIAWAQTHLPGSLRARVTFQVADFTRTKVSPAACDVVVFAWSL